jgi:D-tyrosyl-tRNA(Tyr) deacylase
MKILIQRVSEASVTVENKVVGKIRKGVLVFLGITHNDSETEARFLADKVANLRVFEDCEGKMNLSLKDVGGSALIISQFTLYGDAIKGRRPSFTDAAKPEKAIPLYEYFISESRKNGIKTEAGIFGAKMEVSLVNSGPVTILIEK